VVAYIFFWVFVFVIPWENVVVFSGLGTISKLVGIAAFGVTAARVLLTTKVRRLDSFHWIGFAYLCWVLLSASWAVNTSCSPVFGCPVRNVIDQYLQFFVMLWVLWEVTPTRSRLINLLQAYVLGGYVAASITVYNYAIGASLKHAYGRYAAEGFDPNDLGMVLGLGLPMAWYLGSIATNGVQRWLNRGYFLVGTVAILLTGSRGALLASIVALSVIPWTLTQVRRGVRVAAVVIMFGAAVLAAKFVPEELFKRLSTTTSEISEGTMNDRLQIWKAGIEAVPARPLQGYGPGGWQMALTHELGFKGPHNTYLAILVDEGMIGLLLFLMLFVIIYNRMRLIPNIFERRVGLTILWTFIVAITPLAWDTRKAGWLILGLLISYAEVLRPLRQTAPAPAPVGLRPVVRPRRPVPFIRRPL
jgi:O-antigen ligase